DVEAVDVVDPDPGDGVDQRSHPLGLGLVPDDASTRPTIRVGTPCVAEVPLVLEHLGAKDDLVSTTQGLTVGRAEATSVDRQVEGPAEIIDVQLEVDGRVSLRFPSPQVRAVDVRQRLRGAP